MYRKMIFVVIILLSFVEFASCKTIFVGIMGGPGMYLGDVAEGVVYNPKTYSYGTHDPKLIAQNFTGMDAMSKYIEKRIHGSYLARIYHISAGGGDIASWIESNYQKGDIVLISGYSAGAGIALTVAWGLQDKGIEVDMMGLIDKVSLADDYITSNVKKVYIFYQRNPLNFDENNPNVNKLHGENEFNIEDSNKTSVDSFLISNTTHRLIDNNPASWEVLSVYMVGYVNTLVGNANGNNNAGTSNGNSNNSNANTNENTPPQEEILNPGHTGGGGFNDMKIKTVNMSKGAHSTRHKTLHQEPGEKFYAYAKLDNDGSATAYDFKLKFYIDGGKRNFDRDDDDYQGSIRIDEYNPDAKIRYAKELTAPDKPGTYWVYACVTSIDHDEDKDNNCSDEDDREEWGKLIIDGNPDASSTSKSWDDLTSGEKAAIVQIIFSRRR